MNCFDFFLDVFCLAAQGILHILFISRLTGKRKRLWHFAAYFFLLCILEGASACFPAISIFTIGIQLLILCSISRFALKNSWTTSLVTSILAVYISQLSFGIVNPAETALFPLLIGSPLLYPMLFLAAVISFTLCAACYALTLKISLLQEDGQTVNAILLLFPVLFFFAAELYLLHTFYTSAPSDSSACSIAESGKQAALLSMQLLGLGALFCTLYAHRRICRSFQLQATLNSLTQAAQAQKVYIAEAQTRYNRTKAFRHDIQNHLTVLDGLLRGGKTEEGRTYLHKLEAASSALSFPCQTGNPVVDILLREKLGLAASKQISAEVSLLLPCPCRIDDFDLCVIFANALDNAIRACKAADGTKFIHITGKQQGDFYMLEFVNTCSAEPLPPAGTGLSNIRAVAEKYCGTMLTEKQPEAFCLNVLLNLAASTT